MQITSKIKSYQVEVVDEVLSHATQWFGGPGARRCFYFIDEHFWEHYHEPLQALIGDAPFLTISAIEPNKAYLQLAQYFQFLLEHGFQRGDTLVTFGGGILQDISGFIASTLYRGIHWVFCPTTLLAQADSCIGSKTSINFGASKNLIGTFYPPDLVLIDVGFCQTLTPAYFNSGIGEIIKFHLLSHETGYQRLKEYLSADLRQPALLKGIIQSTLEIKRSYFEGDEFDTGRRNLLNYGHCFGHALESATQFAVSHGEAVMVGMGFANRVARRRGLMTEARYQEIEAILARHYPHCALSQVAVHDMVAYLKKDKKRVTQDLTMILLTDIGQARKCDDVTESEFRTVYLEFVEYYRSFV